MRVFALFAKICSFLQISAFLVQIGKQGLYLSTFAHLAMLGLPFARQTPNFVGTLGLLSPKNQKVNFLIFGAQKAQSSNEIGGLASSGTKSHQMATFKADQTTALFWGLGKEPFGKLRTQEV